MDCGVDGIANYFSRYGSAIASIDQAEVCSVKRGKGNE